ncbi:MAG: diacylglycerol kinase family protein [Clostridia bacterium]|nr:diacylglycerol kinase family protein [Clostridia bacterium]
MKSFLKGFVYAGRGVAYCIANERNFRVHLCFTVYMFCFLRLMDFFVISNAELGVLLALCALVLGFECINTALERAVDLVSSERSELARIAKDTAAGAVLVCAVFAVIAGIVIMYQPEAFSKMYAYYAEHPGMLAILTVSIILSLVFVFLPSYIKEKKKND